MRGHGPDGTDEVVTQSRRRSDLKGRKWTNRFADCEADGTPWVSGVGKFVNQLCIIVDDFKTIVIQVTSLWFYRRQFITLHDDGMATLYLCASTEWNQ